MLIAKARFVGFVTAGLLCASVCIDNPAQAATFGETTGGVANTWTNYANAGGTAGPQIGAYQTVQIACKLPGFQVADGNTWWYRIAQTPWNNSFYVSADAFYNNGATSGSLQGTPFVDPAVPDCSSLASPAGSETTGGVVNTWTNYLNAGGTAGPQIGAYQTVQIACKLPGFQVADGNTWWYRIASSPWNSSFYASADPFYNNGATSGSLQGTPFVDSAIPDCAPMAAPRVTLAQGPAAPAGYRYAVNLSGFGAGASVSISCRDSAAPGGFYTFSLRTDSSGSASTASYCYSGDGPDHWVVAGGISSNHVSWGPGSSSGGLGGTGGAAPPPQVINGVNVGYPLNASHSWGTNCAVQDFNGGPYGRLIVAYTHGAQIVRSGMLWGWFDNGGGPGFGCPQDQEHRYSNGLRQDFDRGSLYWVSGMNHAERVIWRDSQSRNWSGYEAVSNAFVDIRGTLSVPTIRCATSSSVQDVSSWIGIGGEGAGQGLVQGGVAAGCDPGSTAPKYSLFWQKVPYGTGVSVSLGSITPGRVLSVEVKWSMSGAYTIAFSVPGRTIRPITGSFASGSHMTAECIVESSMSATTGAIYLLPSFTAANFSNCQVASSGGILYSAVDASHHGATVKRIDNNIGGTTAGRLRATPTLPISPSGSWSVLYRSP